MHTSILGRYTYDYCVRGSTDVRIQKRFLDFILGTEIPFLVTAGFLVSICSLPVGAV